MEANKIVATVGGKNITQSDVDRMIIELGQRGQNFNNPQGREIILEQAINRELLLLDAEKKLYEYDREFKEELEKVKGELLINFAVKKAVEAVNVTEEDAKAEYDSNPEKFIKGESVSASHILVDSEEKANELLEKITSGQISFEDCARDNSTCPSSANGGSLGEFTRGQMVPEFDTACFSMNVGEIKGPVKTQFGYHLIKLTGKSEAQTMAFEDVKEGLISQMIQEKQQSAYESKINQLKILYPVNKL